MKWISVKDLPTDDNNNGDSYNCVLVFTPSCGGCFAFAQYSGEWELLSDGIYSDVGALDIKVEDITHWMPLPGFPGSEVETCLCGCEDDDSPYVGDTFIGPNEIKEFIDSISGVNDELINKDYRHDKLSQLLEKDKKEQDRLLQQEIKKRKDGDE